MPPERAFLTREDAETWAEENGVSLDPVEVKGTRTGESGQQEEYSYQASNLEPRGTGYVVLDVEAKQASTLPTNPNLLPNTASSAEQASRTMQPVAGTHAPGSLEDGTVSGRFNTPGQFDSEASRPEDTGGQPSAGGSPQTTAPQVTGAPEAKGAASGPASDKSGSKK